tara:strand:- start:522 stop:857 length:336 start_codon:yes stop_codon:yes gene_type:complete
MTEPWREHNTLLSTKSFLENVSDVEKLPDVPEKVRLSAAYLLKTFPSKEVIDELYAGQTIEDLSSPATPEEYEVNPNRILNDNQTWNTPGFKWKTEVEFKGSNEDNSECSE